jgi:segregation and condensation protein B
LLGTTREFLDYFGLKSLDQLPTLAELRDVETIGVQLELPGGEGIPGAEASAEIDENGDMVTEASVADEATNDDSDDDDHESSSQAASDEPELSAEGDEIDAEDETPTLVASDEDEIQRRYDEPPRED